MKDMKTRTLVIAAMLIALSFIGANIKISGSIAFDSMPAFFGALVLGPVAGGIIGLIGHLLTAVFSGFPFGLPVHIIVAVMMYIAVHCLG